jgi:hypothetical protein
MPLMSPHAGKHPDPSMVQELALDSAWGSQGHLHSDAAALKPSDMGAEQWATGVTECSQCVRGVCIRIQERIAVSARNWWSGTHWFQTTNGPPGLTSWFSISLKVIVWSGLWAPYLELLSAAFSFRSEGDVTDQDVQFSEVQSWACHS